MKSAKREKKSVDAARTSFWNYRVVKKVYPDELPADRVQYGIHEAHYYEDTKECFSITQSPVGVVSDSAESMPEVIAMMAGALTKPVLDFDTRQDTAEIPIRG